ncbi:MAG: beta-L-arabinofuranosidase domain-containing protein [Planctomycetota bacterium]
MAIWNPPRRRTVRFLGATFLLLLLRPLCTPSLGVEVTGNKDDSGSVSYDSHAVGGASGVRGASGNWEPPVVTPFANQTPRGELAKRLAASFRRLEETKYRPENVFLTNAQSNYWPGDTEGRTVLALSLLSQASHRPPRHLDEILRRTPERLNSMGYFGDIAPEGLVDEQQLSSHGWVLRGLCEHYEWSRSEATAQMIRRMIDNLVLPTAGSHRRYPIDPDQRRHGGSYSGSRRNKVTDGWVLSTDIGCAFIFMDGVIHAYTLFPSPELKAVVEEMIDRLLDIDLLAIKAQTHATLTGLRGLLRYHACTGDKSLLKAAVSRFALYKSYGMTENYENLNWFGRPTHTEPCAVVDSYLVAAQLWQATGDAVYLEDAHHIYYNGLAAAQRSNGGFGCNTCLGAADGVLRQKVFEAHWCCTMRGAEGLARAAQYGYFTRGDQVLVTSYANSKTAFQLPAGELVVEQTTDYPTGNSSRFTVVSEGLQKNVRFAFFVPVFTEFEGLFHNGAPLPVDHDNGFVEVELEPDAGDEIEVRLRPVVRLAPTINKSFSKGRQTVRYGPLLLGVVDADGHAGPPVDASTVRHRGGREFVAGGVAMRSLYRLLSPDLQKTGDELLLLLPSDGDAE